ncbi:TPA: hypothetical protein RG501_RS13025 [Providencia rettgeri]|nr:hypothetical protein [Providencia rettgeri]
MKTLLKTENTSFIEHIDIENLEHAFKLNDFEYREINDNTAFFDLRNKWAILADNSNIKIKG